MQGPCLRVSCLVILGWVVAVTSLPAQQKPADWPQFRGPGGLGVSPGKGLPLTWSQKENLVWKTALPGPGSSSPIVVGNKVFLTCYGGYNVPRQPRGDIDQLELRLVCLDRDGGKILWSKRVAPKLPEQDTIRENHGSGASRLSYIAANCGTTKPSRNSRLSATIASRIAG